MLISHVFSDFRVIFHESGFDPDAEVRGGERLSCFRCDVGLLFLKKFYLEAMLSGVLWVVGFSNKSQPIHNQFY